MSAIGPGDVVVYIGPNGARGEAMVTQSAHIIGRYYRVASVHVHPWFRWNGISTVEVGGITLATSFRKMVPLLIQLLADGDCSEGDVRLLEREGVVRKLGEIVDMLERRSADMRLRAVS